MLLIWLVKMGWCSLPLKQEVVRRGIWCSGKHHSEGVFLLNTDGFRQSNDGHALAGSLIRDAAGSWRSRFFINIGVTDSLEAELWGI